MVKQIISEICLNKINILGVTNIWGTWGSLKFNSRLQLEDLFDLEYNPQRLVEDLRKDREIVNSDSDSDLDLYSDVLDQIDEFAIKVESLKLHLNKKKQKKAPSKAFQIKNQETNIPKEEGEREDPTKKIK